MTVVIPLLIGSGLLDWRWLTGCVRDDKPRCELFPDSLRRCRYPLGSKKHDPNNRHCDDQLAGPREPTHPTSAGGTRVELRSPLRRLRRRPRVVECVDDPPRVELLVCRASGRPTHERHEIEQRAHSDLAELLREPLVPHQADDRTHALERKADEGGDRVGRLCRAGDFLRRLRPFCRSTPPVAVTSPVQFFASTT